MKKLYSTIAGILIFSFYSNAQVFVREINNLPMKEREKISSDIEIPKFSLEKYDYSELQESSKSITPEPFQFGKAHEVKLGLSNGKWYAEDDNNIWILAISSLGAYSINLIFDELYLPEGAELFLFNMDKSIVMGPIDSGNSKSSEEFWTDLIPGDEITLKLIEPKRIEDKTRISISKIIHGFINTSLMIMMVAIH